MPRKRSELRQTCDYALKVLTWVNEAIENPDKPMGLFKGGALHDEVRKCRLYVKALCEAQEKRASRGRY